MLDNIRRKFSYLNARIFYKKYSDLGRFEEITYHNGVSSALPRIRCTKKKSSESFRYIYKTPMIIKLPNSKIKMKMLPCPIGAFIMGHVDQENNSPRQEIVERSFLLGETEVTQELYKAVMGDNPSEFQKKSKNPVECVSWYDAIRFCNELSKLQGLEECYEIDEVEGGEDEDEDEDEDGGNCEYNVIYDSSKNGYRLPTEKEWEYAAKAGTRNRWAGTDNERDLENYAWFGENEDVGSTHPVATKAPNEWGFYDMSGNVVEWCWDKCKEGYSRVHRGGAWSSNSDSFLRSDDSYGAEPNFCDTYIGFRVCRSIVN